MKQAILSLKKKLLMVELLEGATDIEICPDCSGDGIETCHNPDHGFLSGVLGGVCGANTSACPCCGHSQDHKMRGKCYTCKGTGQVSKDEFGAYLDEFSPENYHQIKLKGKLTDITEEQFALINPKTLNSHGELVYPSYYDSVGSCIGLDSAEESFFSYLEAQGIYFENKLEKPIMEEYGYCEDRDAEGHFYKSYWEPQDGEEKWQESINEWQEAEQKVWNKDLIYVFEII
jgi:hypothetical protein